MKTVHVASVASDRGREGRIETPNDFVVDFSKHTDRGLNPEHLFAGAYAACFHSALKTAAERAHKELKGSSVIGVVRLAEDAKGGYRLGVEMRAALPGLSRSDAERLMHQAHETCPYSRATRGNIDVNLVLD